MDRERRQHRRLAIQLPLECHRLDGGCSPVLRSNTRDISTGGLYFEADVPEVASLPTPDTLFTIELTVPPGEGYFPYQGQIRGVAEVLRCEPLAAPSGEGPN